MVGLITLTTDFGVGSPYVAIMKGVILSINSNALIVDLTHSIPPQDVRQGALILADVCPWYPPGSIHVAVIDPGVGTERRLIYAQLGQQHFLLPDNGLISRLAKRMPAIRIVTLSDPTFWLPGISATFHGRDVLAPVAARLSLGLEPTLLGPPQDELVQLDWPEVSIVPGKITGAVRSVDSFGNLITDISAEMLADAPRDERTRITCDEHETLGIFSTYGDQPPMTLMALIGSNGQLELAIVNDSAAAMLGVGVGTPVTVQW